MKSGCISQSEDKDVPYNILKMTFDQNNIDHEYSHDVFDSVLTHI